MSEAQLLTAAWPKWRGRTCVIVASGPSAKNVPLEKAKDNAKFIAINESWRLAPWADVLYGCDKAFWDNADGCPGFKGTKVTLNRQAAIDWGLWLVTRRSVDRMLLKPRGTIGWGGNSGFGALNLAIQSGCRRIVLVGYDMTLDNGSHWHGDHVGTSNPVKKNVNRWRSALEKVAPTIAEAGVEVINCSPVSTLKAYPKMAFEDAL